MIKAHMTVKTYYEGMYGVSATPTEVAGERLEGRVPVAPPLASPTWEEALQRLFPNIEFIGEEEAFLAGNEAAREEFFELVRGCCPRDRYNVAYMHGATYALSWEETYRVTAAWLRAFRDAGGTFRHRLFEDWNWSNFPESVAEMIEEGS